MSSDPEIRTLDTKVVYQNRWMTVHEDRILRSDGREGLYGVVDKPDFAAIVPLLGDQIVLVSQYRYTVKQRYWEIPQGSWESKVAPEDLARAELREETGYEARSMEHVAFLYAAYGFSTQGYHLFVARELEAGPTQLDAEEVGLVSRAFPLTEVLTMVNDGTIRDATTVAALGLLRLRGLL